MTPTKQMLSLLRRAKGHVNILVSQYGQSRDAATFAARLADSLDQWHAEAAYHGRQQAGDLAPMDADDREFGRVAAEEDLEYLDGFHQAIAAGKYVDDDGAVTAGMENRADMYVTALERSFNEAFVLASDEGDSFWWKLGGVNNCPDCIELAGGGPYPAAEMPTVPGGGATQCLTRCNCFLERSDGVNGFALPSNWAEDDSEQEVA